MWNFVVSCIVLLGTLFEVALSDSQQNKEIGPVTCEQNFAICRICNGSVEGYFEFRQVDENTVTVSGSVSGLEDKEHGFHVHKFGDLSNGCNAAGPHYNPFNKTHGAPTDKKRHVGDLGNIEARSGVANVDIRDNELRLCGPHSIMGRGLVVHINRDDLGKGDNEESKKTGNAGPRIGCCAIVAAQPKQ